MHDGCPAVDEMFNLFLSSLHSFVEKLQQTVRVLHRMHGFHYFQITVSSTVRHDSVHFLAQGEGSTNFGVGHVYVSFQGTW